MNPPTDQSSINNNSVQKLNKGKKGIIEKGDPELKNRLKSNLYYFSNLKDTLKHRQVLASTAKQNSQSMAKIGLNTIQATLMQRQKSEKELVPLNSSRGKPMAMASASSLNKDSFGGSSTRLETEDSNENLGSPIKGKLTDRRLGPGRAMNRVKSTDWVKVQPRREEVAEEVLQDKSLYCSNPKRIYIEDKIKKIGLLTNPGDNSKAEVKLPQRVGVMEFIAYILDNPDQLKFAYASRLSAEFYDYYIMPYWLVNQMDQMTVSSNSIIHSSRDEEPTTISLPMQQKQWKAQQVLKSIPFFQKYKKWRNFTVLKNFMRRTNLDDTKNKIGECKLLFDPDLKEANTQVLRENFKVANLDFIAFTKMDTQIEDFMKDNRNEIDKCTDTLHRRDASIRDLCKRACDKSYTNYCMKNRIRIENSQVDEGREDNRGALIGDGSNRRMEFTQLAAQTTHSKKLVRFIKLKDIMLIRSNLQLALDVMAKVKENLRFTPAKFEAQNDKKKKRPKMVKYPIFKILAEFDEDTRTLVFKPSLAEFKERLSEVLKQAHERIAKVDLLSLQTEFQDHIRVKENEGTKDSPEDPDIMPKIMQQPQQGAMKLDIDNIIEDSYLKLEEFKTDRLQQWLEMILSQIDVDAQEMWTWSVERFNSQLATLRSYSTSIKELKKDQHLELHRLDCDNIIKQVEKIIIRTENKFKEMLPRLISFKCTDLNGKLNEAIGKLTSVINKVKSFCEFHEYQCNLKQRWENLFSENVEIQDFKEFMIKKGWEFAEEECEKTKLLTSKCEEALNEKEAQEEDNRIKWKNQLEKDIPALAKRATDIETQISTSDYDTYVEPENTEGVLSNLLGLKSQVDKIRTDVADQENFKETLDSTKEIPESIEEICDLQDNKLKMWRTKNNYEKAFLRISPLSIAEFEKVKQKEVEEVEKMMQDLMKAKGQLSEQNLCASETQDKLKEFRESVIAISKIHSPFVDERKHIKKNVNENLGFNYYKEEEVEVVNPEDNTKSKQKVIKGQDDMSVQAMMDKGIARRMRDFVEIENKAKKEIELQKVLDELQTAWDRNDKFRITTEKEVEKPDEIFDTIDDSFAKVADIQSNKYGGFFEKDTDRWSKHLAIIQNLLLELINCQRSQKYFEKIFNAKDIKENLAEENKMFNEVKKEYDNIVNTTIKLECQGNLYKQVVDNGNRDIDKIALLMKNLDKIKKKVEEYLEEKRKQFSRFYFLSTDELLDLLSEQDKLDVVTDNLKKFFDNIQDLVKADDTSSSEKQVGELRGLKSGEGEVLVLKNPILMSLQTAINEWLNAMQENMIKSIQEQMQDCLAQYITHVDIAQDWTRDFWIKKYNSQCAVTITQLLWTRECEKCIVAKKPGEALDEQFAVLDENLDEYTNMLISKDENGRGLNKDVRNRVIAIITGEVHNKDVVNMLKIENVQTHDDFNWKKQLRFQENNELIRVEQANSVINQGQEQLGALSRLVITPLTERCWSTITGALALRLGAAPAGPAGTGKTESVKDLSKGLAIFCLVFNCGPTVETPMVVILCCGLCQQGAWACLDEFNRINLEVLSVIAEMMSEIKDKRLRHTHSQEFEDTFQGINVKQRQTMGSYITMNPGQAGRNELPDNLQVSFRPVAMMVPNQKQIAEIMIQAFGFKNASEKASKMAKLLILNSEQLSQQPHYDFGMRALKSILMKCGEYKKNYPDEKDEDQLLIRAMLSANKPKFLEEDKRLFEAILKQDLQPGKVIKEQDFEWLEEAITECTSKDNKTVPPIWLEKMLQFYDTCNLRFGVILVGPPNSGKSQILETLRNSINWVMDNKFAENNAKEISAQNPLISGSMTTKQKRINPKSITKEELQGQLDPQTQEWREGLGASIMKGQVREGQSEFKWLIFDGPVDAIWIEDMNSVLDDSMLLCLGNGERIKLNTSMRILFEVADLNHASLATVSRVGVIQVPEDAVGFKAYINAFLINSFKGYKFFESEVVELSTKLFNEQLPGMIHWYRETVKKSESSEPISTMEMQQVQVAGNLFHSLMIYFKLHCDKLAEDEEWDEGRVTPEVVSKVATQMFIFSLIWAFGGSLSDGWRLEFNNEVKHQLKKLMPNPNGMWWEFQPDLADGLEVNFNKWDSIVPKFTYNPKASFFDMVVPTKETITYSRLMEYQVKCQQPVFFTGLTGAGKTLVCQQLLESLKSEKQQPVQMYFSAKTDSYITQKQIENSFKGSGARGTVGPTGGQKKGILMIDDINMPMQETQEAQPPVELVRQFMGQEGVQERTGAKEFKKSKDIVTVALSAPPTGCRAVLSTRISKFFHVLNIPKASSDSLKKIFENILGGFIQTTLPPDYQETVSKSVLAAIKVYQEIEEKIKPTPVKTHQSQNLRDVSKIIQGVMGGRKQTFGKKEIVQKLIAHEASRVFRDRLVDETDQKIFDDLLMKICKSDMNLAAEDLSEVFKDNGIIFCNFNKGDFLQNQVQSIEQVKIKLNGQLKNQNDINPDKMNLVFFVDAIKHICRISRVLKQGRGNCLLVGISGSGRQSLSRLATSILEQKLKPIVITKNFKMDDFQTTIIELMRTTGAEQLSTTFLVNETDIKFEAQVESINNLLNTGEVPNLFESNQLNMKAKEDIMQTVRERATKDGFSGNQEALFVSKVRENLHIILSFNPIGATFRERVRMFPSLVNSCAIDWFQPWPQEALIEVANDKFSSFRMNVGTKEEDANYVKMIIEMCPYIHMTSKNISNKFYSATKRNVQITPKNYLDLIENYKIFFVSSKKSQDDNIRKYKKGVEIMNKSSITAKELVEEVKRMTPEVEKKKAQAEEQSKNAAEAEKKANVILESQKENKARVEKQVAEAKAIMDNVSAELAIANKVKLKAEDAVAALKDADVTEVKGFNMALFDNKPHIMSVVKAILLLLTGKMDLKVWKSSVSVGALRGFKLSDIKDQFDKQDKICKKQNTWYKNDENINFDSIKKTSQALAGLYTWTDNIAKFQEKIEQVLPLENQAKEAKEAADKASKELDIALAEYNKIMAEVRNLQKTRDDALAEAQVLTEKLGRFQMQLSNSDSLTSSLEEEYSRWSGNVTTIQNQITNLIGDVFIAASSLSYQGAFTGTQRDALVSDWLKKCQSLNIPRSDTFNLDTILSDPLEVRNWRVNGLPSDKVSVCNACLATKSTRQPILVDPQELAQNWLKNLGLTFKPNSDDSNNFKEIKHEKKEKNKQIAKAIEAGWTVLVWDCPEKLDNNIDMLLMQKSNSIGSEDEFKVNFEGKELKVHPCFRLQVATKVANPAQLPETFIKATIVNFMVTAEGLEEDLLTKTVGILRPEDERQSKELVEEIAKNDNVLADLEKNILKSLLDTDGQEGQNVLEDNELIKMLQDSKVKSTDIKEKKIKAEDTNNKLLEEKKKFTSISIRGSILYFILVDLAGIDCMQQFSLSKFNELFEFIIAREKETDTDNLILHLIDALTEYIFSQCSRALFEEHKIIFGFLIAMKVSLKEKSVNNEELVQLLTGVKTGFTNFKDLGRFDWLEEKQMKAVQMLDSFVHLKLEEAFAMQEKDWKKWVRESEPHLVPMPGDTEKATMWQKCLIIKALRPEKLIFSMKFFVRDKIGDQFANPLPVKMLDVFPDTDARSPVIFILAKGADPGDTIKDLARTQGKDKDIIELSLGSGSEEKARSKIKSSSKDGTWVILCNCHLFEDWLPELLKECDAIRDSSMSISDKDQRLFLTARPCNRFPIPLLQQGVKVAQEPPKGLKKNMIGSLLKYDDTYFSNIDYNQQLFKRLAFGAIFMHAVILERKKYGPLGFNKAQDFNESDLSAALDTLKDLCNRPMIPQDAITYMLGEITQGGRVTEELDFRTLLSTLTTFLNDSVKQGSEFKYSESGIQQCTDFDENNLTESWRAQVKSLPDQDPPEIFGMHSNADIAFQRDTSDSTCDIILSIQSEDAANDEEGGDGDKQLLEMVNKYIENLPEKLVRADLSEKNLERDSLGNISIQTTFLFQEMEKFNKLLGKMLDSLRSLKDAIQGIALMSTELDKMLSAFLINRVPPNWTKLSFLSLKPLNSWQEDLQQRVKQLKVWMTTQIPAAHYMTAQYFPQGLLTSCLQSYSRNRKTPIDELDFLFDTIPQTSPSGIPPIEDGLQVQGMYCDGFGYDFKSNQMADQEPGITYIESPVVWFKPLHIAKGKQLSEYQDANDQLCPIYKTTTRSGTLSTTGLSTNFIKRVSLYQNMSNPDYWVKKGAAFVLNLND